MLASAIRCHGFQSTQHRYRVGYTFFFFPGAMLAQLEACTTSYMKRFAQHLDTDSILN